jgi:hypothetical protein
LIIVLAGRGHNGADARNALEQLEERRIDVLQVHDPKNDFEELETLLKLRPALIIDGLFGIGINRPLDAAWIRFIERINAFQLPVLAVDLPSGLNADTGEPQGAAIKAMVTLTVGAPKSGLLRQCAWPYVGRLEVATHIGLIPCPFKRNELDGVRRFRRFPANAIRRESQRNLRSSRDRRRQRRLSWRSGAGSAGGSTRAARIDHVVST